MKIYILDSVLIVLISFKASQNIYNNSEYRKTADYNIGSRLFEVWLLTHLFGSFTTNNSKHTADTECGRHSYSHYI